MANTEENVQKLESIINKSIEKIVNRLSIGVTSNEVFDSYLLSHNNELLIIQFQYIRDKNIIVYSILLPTDYGTFVVMKKELTF